jgi:predicted CopG family antitoxin
MIKSSYQARCIIVAKRLTISIDEEVYEYLEHAAGDNRSAFINDLLRQHHLTDMKARMIQGLQEDAQDTAYQEEIAEWDVTLADGLSDAD